jgi:two-component system sensor histidine kinase ChvG
LFGGSKLGRLILVLNLLALAVLVAGALLLNELRPRLVQARVDQLATQGELIGNLMEALATQGEPEPYLDEERARAILLELFIARGQRARLFDPRGRVIADTDNLAARVDVRELPPARKPGQAPPQASQRRAEHEAEARAGLAAELDRVLETGQTVADTRVAPDGGRLVSVSLPIQHVRAVLGVLTVEAGDVDAIIAAERRALLPFILIAVGVLLVSSLLMNGLIARPIERLARAADSVRLARARAIELPDLSARDDEIGDLTQSLEAMTDALSSRIDAIERFAADVAHELRNPLTSVRSAVETLELVPAGPGRERLQTILKNDVGRLDRLITDIANASRLDAELSREAPRPLDLHRLLSEIVALYVDTARPGEVSVAFADEAGEPPPTVQGREGPLGQVVRNLIDNARSFSPPGGEVRVRLHRDRVGGRRVARIVVEDDGPACPPTTWKRCSSASTPRDPRARRSAATRAWGSRSPARSSMRTAVASGPRTGWTRTATSTAPCSR